MKLALKGKTPSRKGLHKKSEKNVTIWQDGMYFPDSAHKNGKCILSKKEGKTLSVI